MRHRSRQVKRVVKNEVQCRPFTNFARLTVTREVATLAHLTNEVNGRASVKAAEIVKHARVPAVSRERAKSRSYELVGHSKSVFHRARLRYKPLQVVAIEGERESSEVTVAEDRGIQLIESLVIETFGNSPSHVLIESVYAQDRAGNGIALNQV